MSWKLPADYQELAPKPSIPQELEAVGLTPRLATLAGHVDAGSRIVDIGTDHGLIPIALMKNQRSCAAIAIDKKIGPLTIAQQNISKFKLDGKIALRLGDGFSALKSDEADTAILAGMSGEHMAAILTKQDLKKLGITKLIVQPNTNLFAFRKHMAAAGWQIVDESMVACGRRSYIIMVLAPGCAPFTLAFEDALLGPILRNSPDNLLYQLWLKLMLQRSAQKVRGYQGGTAHNGGALEEAQKQWRVFQQAYASLCLAQRIKQSPRLPE